MFSLPFARLARSTATRRFVSSISIPRTRNSYRSLAWGTSFAVAACLAYTPTKIHLDSQVKETAVNEDGVNDTVVDPATSIVFPKTMKIPANIKLPPLTLLGVGVRTVSFLGIKVYSVGFYADLSNPNLKILPDMTAEEKIKHIVQNTSCVIRIVPTRSTSYTHLRDAFMRALQTRLAAGIKEGRITEEVAQAAASPMRKLKSLFPNSPLAKHTPLDIFLSAPMSNRPRALVFRDLGSIDNDWAATEFVLHYFEGDGPSPPVRVLSDALLIAMALMTSGDHPYFQAQAICSRAHKSPTKVRSTITLSYMSQ
ncbi:chalcone-flavanone isomerase-domain-containing protein [Crassisporium funariophilum]|nr:chalcone-flavanone isomerase-domain-containing protein [Crassisporium funariophilum]